MARKEVKMKLPSTTVTKFSMGQEKCSRNIITWRLNEYRETGNTAHVEIAKTEAQDHSQEEFFLRACQEYGVRLFVFRVVPTPCGCVASMTSPSGRKVTKRYRNGIYSSARVSARKRIEEWKQVLEEGHEVDSLQFAYWAEIWDESLL